MRLLLALLALLVSGGVVFLVCAVAHADARAEEVDRARRAGL